MARIVLATFGSRGDLNPYLAVARALLARGHTPIVATSASYREVVEATGARFAPVRPDLVPEAEQPEMMARVMDQHRGTAAVVALIMPRLRESYEDTLVPARDADLLVSHPLTLTVRLVAETTGVPWASSLLQPLGLFSAHDPPVIPPAPWMRHARALGPGFHRGLFALGRASTRRWVAPWGALRRALGLPPVRENPLFSGQHSPALVLAMFSPLLAPPQPDWPRHTVVTGFPFGDDERPMPRALEEFLDAGEPPALFTLGTSAVHDPRAFWDESVAAARAIGRRAVLLVGERPPALRHAHGPDVHIAAYAPHAQVMPRAFAIVHQGGIGTTAQAMRAGRPMLVVPFAHDQFDNAARVAR
ncbi:MAG TPA: glycosyltransferase, partial [Candidatus Eisenbacteria bacterium]|nr:glycosyltransferase [Candidatus Eisenbacteria bacterium]